MKPVTVLFVASSFLATSLLIGCTTVGQGAGELEDSAHHEEPVTLSWKSSNSGESGILSATLLDGRVFSGPFYQILSQTELDQVGPLWTGWDYGWYGWDYWGTGPQVDFVTRYTGKVVANLASSSGERMRCRFHLVQPYKGMEGGGNGECELSNHDKLSAYFPAQ
ncbi:hypothetical protein [Methylomonas methanica]|uniref:Lipoprotein n=1 Tax=Methylomonas methanica (strain DSM 25384 / MC09) TaxID=857087 RepID=G0A319_METMM|nr:hypothetical protein [Methylomonas methanica]AEG02678.1 hypothetical protein Metme_4329 [Methylomonas methanica MC09]